MQANLQIFRPASECYIDFRRAKRMQTEPTLCCFRRHAWPVFGEQRLDMIQRPHIAAWVEGLVRRVAPSTAHNAFNALAGFFRWAVTRELVKASPCDGLRTLLPRRRNVDPEHAKRVRYTREEVGRLVLSRELVLPEVCRVLWALLFYTGARVGEARALLWRHWEEGTTPLGTLHIVQSYRSQSREVRGTKTGEPRALAVHPSLAAHLEAWRTRGWREAYGRDPGPEDLVFARRLPDGALGHLYHHSDHVRLRRACAALGITYRTIHALRATFLTCAQADGANPTIITRMTHTRAAHPAGAVAGLYTRYNHEELCAELLKLRPLTLEEAA